MMIKAGVSAFNLDFNVAVVAGTEEIKPRRLRSG
jgi:hypothetical protein